MALAGAHSYAGSGQANTLILTIGVITERNSGGQTRLRSGRNEMGKRIKIYEGWAKPWPSRKYHYFFDGKSLCGNWEMDGPIRQKLMIDGFCKACDYAFEKKETRNSK